MITKIEASGYCCLREVNQELQPYKILVGPNGSGKSAFLDVVAFFGDLVSSTLKQTVDDRTDKFDDLVWGRKEGAFRLAIEAEPPFSEKKVRYEVEVRLDAHTDELALCDERLSVLDGTAEWLPVVTRRDVDLVSFSAEKGDLRFDLRLNPGLSGLANLPADATAFPAAVWLKSLLQEGVKTVRLDNDYLRASSPRGLGKARFYDGFNLPRLIEQASSSRTSFEAWLKHVQTAIPDVLDIRVITRPEDRSRYVVVKYVGGVELPAWTVSDGTMRLIALTLLAYLPEFQGVYLVEEPEIGLHPTAIETVIQSLSSVYEGQVLITSHSPAVLSLARPDQLLCFQKVNGATTIISGDKHPILQEWKAGVNVSDLFAAGVLG
jgi:predicted ATPase